MASAPTLRMDRSKPYSTVHGERLPGDVHQNTHFYQDGMPFGADGKLLYDVIQDDDVRALADRKLKKLGKTVQPDSSGADATQADAETDDDDTAPAAPGDVNLEAWLREEASYPWHLVTKAVRERHHQNISKQKDMVVFLVEDLRIVQPDQVGPSLRKFLTDDAK